MRNAYEQADVDIHVFCIYSKLSCIQHPDRHASQSQQHHAQREVTSTIHRCASAGLTGRWTRFFRHDILLEVLVVSANHVPGRGVLAYHVPTLRPRGAVRSGAQEALIVKISSRLIVCISTVDRSASHFGRRFPHQLCEVTGLLCEARRLLEIIESPFIAPRIDSRSGIGVTKGEIFAIGTVLGMMLLENRFELAETEYLTECFQIQASAQSRA